MFLYIRKFSEFKNSVGRRLILFILLFSSLVTFIGTSLQLYFEYSSDMKSIQNTFKQIESSYLKSLSSSLWTIDKQQADILLNGILQLPDIQFLEIRQGSQVFSSAGEPGSNKIIQREFRLIHTYKGQDNDLGVLITTASLKGVYVRLKNRILMVFVTQTVKTFLVSAFILYLFYTLVGRHLSFMAGYAKKVNLQTTYTPLKLQREQPKHPDELEQLVHSYNTMNKNIFNHITAVKQAEKDAENAEKRLRTLIEKSPLPMVISDENQDILFVNDKFTDLFGYVTEDLNNLQACWETLYPDRIYREKVQQFWTEAVELGKENKKEIAVQIWEMTTKERSKKTCEFYMVPLDEMSLIIINDITHREAALLEKERLEKQLAQVQKLESIGRLAGGIAHDFNNMLSIILGNSEILVEDSDLNHQSLSNVKEIQQAAERSANLTQKLLAFARKQTILPRTINLNSEIEGMLRKIRRLIGEDIDLLWQPEKNIWPVKIDPSQVDQILADLCANARDAIQGAGKIVLKTENVHVDKKDCREHHRFMPGDYVLLSISDNGCGMDPEMVKNVFEPFFTSEKFGERAGLGLATVYGIIKQNHGFIYVNSEQEKGTEFKIYIPKHGEPLIERPAVGKEKLQEGFETILLVEDEDSVLRMTKMMLERLGYKVLTANTPDKAMEISKKPEIQIDLLMTDVVMPFMNGSELAQEILKLSPEIKCLFISGYTADVITHRGMLEEESNFISKPFSLHELSAKIRTILSKK